MYLIPFFLSIDQHTKTQEFSVSDNLSDEEVTSEDQFVDDTDVDNDDAVTVPKGILLMHCLLHI